ncbi:MULTISPECIES: WXG100 family type VII secretion target [Nocardia]|uniref:WXG100 family type VII secretion target n=1 Tax=Nocardia TaxID=1817 RepID=UPI001894BA1B|nr:MULTISPECIES: WXG100 family type VII secretion target [Nocardia]MBF6351961.1 WXG100 family type VII secretion target [Nocardia flavorosea]
MTGEFGVDPAALEDLTARLRGYQGFLEDCLTGLESHIRGMDPSWSGLAATAFNDAHRDWSKEVQDIRDSVTDLEKSAAAAHTSYTNAATANAGIFRRR